MTQTFAQKLNLRPGMQLAIEAAPEEVQKYLVSQLPDNPVHTGISGDEPSVLLFIRNLDETTSLVPSLLKKVKPSTIVWLSYPKGSSGVVTDINRDILWKVIASMGWHPVRQIALDEVWSALRFMPNKPE